MKNLTFTNKANSAQIVFKNGWASLQRMYPQGWGVIEGRKSSEKQAEQWATELGLSLESPAPLPFFFNFARNNGHVRATVELHHENGTVDHTTVEMLASEFVQDCIESGVHELAGTDHPEGLAEYAYYETDLVFCKIHAIRPFVFTTQTA